MKLSQASPPTTWSREEIYDDDALGNVMAFRDRMRLLVDSEPAWDRLRALIATYGCTGKQVHDANIVATALTSGVARLVTANAGDFNRFAADIEAIDLATLDPARS